MNRNEELERYRTVTKDGHPTFDLERYYNEMSTEDLIKQRDKTIASLEKYPDFGPQFYTNFIVYLNEKIDQRYIARCSIE